jgi:YVTN family beta-propeller protein
VRADRWRQDHACRKLGRSMGTIGASGGNGVERPAAVEPEASVRTFLIADVRGYTSFTQSHGDEEAGKLAARFAELARKSVETMGGELLELRGDEALCVFSSARQGLRAALELQKRFRARTDTEPVFPLGIGIGLAAGEAVPIEGGYRGGPLNLAARLCSLAGPGQILASETVTSLAGTLNELRFVERRGAHVKGLEKPVRVVEVVPKIALPPVPEAPRASARRRTKMILAAGVVLLAAALAATVLALTRNSKQPATIVAANSVAVIDASTSEVVDAVPVGEGPGPIAAGHDSLWVVNVNDRTLMKIDASTRSVVASVGLPVPAGLLSTKLRLAVTPDEVWVYACHLRLLRIEPDSSQVVQDLEVFRDIGAVADYSCAVAADANSVWVPLDYPQEELLRVAAPEAEPGTIAERFPLPAGFRSAMALGAGSLWIADRQGGAVHRIDPATGAVTKTISLSDGPSALAFGHGGVWVANGNEDSVLRIRPGNNSIVRAISVGKDPAAIAVGPDSIWVANSGDGTVSRIDPATNTVTGTIRIGHRPLGVAVGDGLVWVTVRE